MLLMMIYEKVISSLTHFVLASIGGSKDEDWRSQRCTNRE